MAVATSRRAATATPTAIPSRAPGFRPSSRSRVRIAVGTLLAIGAVGVMLLIFSTADKRVPVLQLVRDVPAGQRLVGADMRTIEVSADPTLAVVHAKDLDLVVGSYARVRMISGSLLASPMLQVVPLVGAGSAVVAITIPTGELPAGLRERSRVRLVFPVATSAAGGAVPMAPVDGRIIGLPEVPDSVTGKLSLSIEVAAADAVTVAQAASVRVVLLDPGVDAADEVAPAVVAANRAAPAATTAVGG